MSVPVWDRAMPLGLIFILGAGVGAHIDSPFVAVVLAACAAASAVMVIVEHRWDVRRAFIAGQVDGSFGPLSERTWK